MELLLAIVLIAGGSYAFVKSKPLRHAEAVRAHLFLSGILNGATVANASESAKAYTGITSGEVLQGATRHLNEVYGGKRAAMIASAYRYGMGTQTPLWYRTFLAMTEGGRSTLAGKAPKAVGATGGARDSSIYRRFATYFLASTLRFVRDGNLPAQFIELMTGKGGTASEQAILLELRLYLQKTGHPPRTETDYKYARDACRQMIGEEVRLAKSDAAIRRWIRTESDGPSTELQESEQLTEIRARLAADQIVELNFLILVMNYNLQMRFKEENGISIDQFNAEIASMIDQDRASAA